MRIKKGDKVQVLSGKDRGKQANVARALPAEGKVIVDLEFDSAPNDPAPPDTVLELARKQDAVVKSRQPA